MVKSKVKCDNNQVKACAKDGKLCNVETNRCVDPINAEKTAKKDPTLVIDKKNSLFGTKGHVQQVLERIQQKSSSPPKKASKKSSSPPKKASKKSSSPKSPTEDLSKMTVAQLKERLRKLNLPIGGLKGDLIKRLQDALKKPVAPKRPGKEEISEEETPAPAKKAVSPKKTAVNLDTMTVAQLRMLAKEKGQSGYSKLKKDELIALLKPLVAQKTKKLEEQDCRKDGCKDDDLCNVETGKCAPEAVGDQEKLYKLTDKGQVYYGSEKTLKAFAQQLKIDESKIEPLKMTPEAKAVEKALAEARSSLISEEDELAAEEKRLQEEEEALAREEERMKKVEEEALKKAEEEIRKKQQELARQAEAIEEARKKKAVVEEPSILEAIEAQVAKESAAKKKKSPPAEAPPAVAAKITQVTGGKPLSKEQQAIVEKIRKCIGI